jgi:hypothetical protein
MRDRRALVVSLALVTSQKGASEKLAAFFAPFDHHC